MEYTIKNKVIALIFPAICVLYGLLDFRIYSFQNRSFGMALFAEAVPLLAVIGGIITGFTAVRLKVDFVPYLKILTLGTVISYLLYILFEMYFFNAITTHIMVPAVLAGAVFLMTVKQPEDTSPRDRLLLTFANPVLYSLLNKLCGLLMEYLIHIGALAE